MRAVVLAGRFLLEFCLLTALAGEAGRSPTAACGAVRWL
jgi:hypothetical protein